MKHITSLLSLLMIPAASAFTFSEASAPGGDFDTTGSSPTILGSTSLGLNTVTGQISQGGSLDQDHFTFNVPTGFELSSLSLSSVNGTNHFIGLTSGTASATAGSGFLFASLVGNPQQGDNFLSTLSTGGAFGGSGFTAPLGAGDYTIFFNETAAAQIPVDYTFAINTTVAVPEPSSTLLLGLVGLAGITRRRR